MLGAAQSAVSDSADKAVAKRDVLAPGAQYGGSLTSQINFISLAIALVLGTAGLPHVLMRFYTVPTAKEARRSVVWAIVADRCLLPVHPGAGLRCRGPRRSRRNTCGSRRPELGRTTAGIPPRRRRPARRHLCGGVRDDPCRGRRPHHHRGNLVRARHLCQRAEERRGDRGPAGAGVAHHRCGDRHPVDRPGHPGRRAEHRVPGRAGLRGRGGGEPARRSCTRSTGRGSTPAARCGACTAA